MPHEAAETTVAAGGCRQLNSSIKRVASVQDTDFSEKATAWVKMIFAHGAETADRYAVHDIESRYLNVTHCMARS
jgi:hypothetical protein